MLLCHGARTIGLMLNPSNVGKDSTFKLVVEKEQRNKANL